MAKPKKNRNVTPASRGKHYYDKKKTIRKDGTVHAGAGKRRPHHARMGKEGVKTEHQKKMQEQTRIHQTPNRYQSEAKKISDNGTVEVYEWMEDNGHADHVQMRRREVIKDEERMPLQFGGGGSEQYKENYTEIFGEKKRGVNVKGGYKKFKKTY